MEHQLSWLVVIFFNLIANFMINFYILYSPPESILGPPKGPRPTVLKPLVKHMISIS